MKQLQTTEKKIGGNTFYIRPFKAFVAANISAELVNVLSPVLSLITALIGDNEIGEKAAVGSIFDMDAGKVIDAAAPALSRINGDKIESTMRKLMLSMGNVSVEGEITDGKAVKLTEDLANEIFCGELQDMYLLCFEIIRVNFKGFFKKLGGRFGSLLDNIPLPRETTQNTETST